MLNRDQDHQFTLFGRGVKRSHLNWGNTAFLFLVAYLGGRELEKDSHKPGDDLDTFSEKFFMALTFLALLLYVFINKKQLGNYFSAASTALTPLDHPMNPPRDFIIALPQEEKFFSQTLVTCLERSKRIQKKIEKIKEAKEVPSEECPKKYECPISLHAMKCPVVASDGGIYDYDSIYPIITTTKKSPLTREDLSQSLNPLPLLQDEIEEWTNAQIKKVNKATNSAVPLDARNGQENYNRPKLS